MLAGLRTAAVLRPWTSQVPCATARPWSLYMQSAAIRTKATQLNHSKISRDDHALSSPKCKLAHRELQHLAFHSSTITSQPSQSVTSQKPAPSPSQPPRPAPLPKTTTEPTSWVSPYLALARWDKPIGSLLLFWPCAWSLTLAAQATSVSFLPLAGNIALFGIGAFVMRGAGCTINDMWDSRMDRLVERTCSRPLAAGTVNYLQAWTFLGVQLTAGLGVLLQLNWYSIVLGASSLGVVVIYPLMKRITYWPQFVLGLAFNWGAFLGWSALSPPPPWGVVVPLYLGSICWTLVYDTIYAHQDKRDDIGAGVKSTALLFGDRYSKPILAGFSVGFLSLVTKAVASSTVAASTAGSGVASLSMLSVLATYHPCFLASLLPLTAHLTWQIYTLDMASRADCWSKFVSNQWLGLMLWLGLFGDYLLDLLVTG